jgi:hypothetical protein
LVRKIQCEENRYRQAVHSEIIEGRLDDLFDLLKMHGEPGDTSRENGLRVY